MFIGKVKTNLIGETGEYIFNNQYFWRKKLKSYLYLRSIWTHISVFSDLFNDMSILAYDSQGRAIGYKRVPVTLGPKQKVIAAIIADQPGATIFPPDNYLPRISITWSGFSRDAERNRGNHEKRRLFVDYDDLDCQNVRTDLQTVPYKMSFEVTLWTKYMDDMAQLLENIIPFFNPDAPVSMVERGVGLERKAQVYLTSVQTNFANEMANTDIRLLQSNLTFDMEINFYRPENPISKPIKRVTTRLGTDSTIRTTDFSGKFNASDEPNVAGEIINTASIPCVSGSEDFLDYDNRTWSVITEFDPDLGKYMADRYHNLIEVLRPVVPSDEPTYNPNTDNKTKDPYYDMYGTQFDIGMEGYTFEIPEIMYNKQVFVPDGQTIEFTWTWDISASGVDEFGREGTLYSGDSINTSNVSGSYFVENPNLEIFCPSTSGNDIIDDEGDYD